MKKAASLEEQQEEAGRKETENQDEYNERSKLPFTVTPTKTTESSEEGSEIDTNDQSDLPSENKSKVNHSETCHGAGSSEVFNSSRNNNNGESGENNDDDGGDGNDQESLYSSILLPAIAEELLRGLSAGSSSIGVRPGAFFIRGATFRDDGSVSDQRRRNAIYIPSRGGEENKEEDEDLVREAGVIVGQQGPYITEAFTVSDANIPHQQQEEFTDENNDSQFERDVHAFQRAMRAAPLLDAKIPRHLYDHSFSCFPKKKIEFVSRHKKMSAAFFILFLIFIVTSVVLIMQYAMGDKPLSTGVGGNVTIITTTNSSTSSTNLSSYSPTFSPIPFLPTSSPRLKKFFSVLMSSPKINKVTQGDMFWVHNSSSPQYKAAHWLADIDARNVSFSMVNNDDSFLQRYALAILFFSTQNDTINNENNNSWSARANFLSHEHECEWNVPAKRRTHSGVDDDKKGVSCDEDDSLIIRDIVLYENKMKGSIPREIGLLTGLRSIELWSNEITGPIPESIGNLVELNYLDLAFNALSGNLPTTIGLLKDLVSIYCSHNGKISGPIPEEFGNLSSLESVDLQSNLLTGSIPSSLGKLSNLVFLDLGVNDLTGTLHKSLFKFRNMTYFFVSKQRRGLNGTFDLEWGDFPQLKFLFLWGNKFSGTIPSSVATLKKIEWLVLSINKFSGTIPSSLGTLSNLKTLSIEMNSLITGTIPSSLGDLTNIEWFFLSDNNLEGTIPSELFRNQPNLGLIHFHRNRNLAGTIPSTISNFSNLWTVSLDGNKLTGNIPSEIGTNENLRFLQLANNNLVGTVPRSIMELKRLDYFSVHRNDLVDNLNPFCDHKMKVLTADCSGPNPEVRCDCCQGCCRDNGELECFNRILSGVNFRCYVISWQWWLVRPPNFRNYTLCNNEQILLQINNE